MSAPKFDYVVLFVSDLEASTKFYTEVLGFETDPSQSDNAFTALKGGTIDFGLAVAKEDTLPVGATMIYFRPQDLEGLRTEIANKGAEVSPIMKPPFGTIFTVTAPDHLITMLV
jgi:predicted enzyme related to lactoylglutathione lyase